MFERFTEAARRAVIDAQEHARALGAEEVGAEHLLLALAAGDGTVAAAVLAGAGADAVTLEQHLRAQGGDDEEALRALGIDLGTVRRHAEATFGSGALDRPSPAPRGFLDRLLGSGHVRFGAAAKEALENSLREAIALQHRQLGAEHVLLGLLTSDRAPAAHLLRRAGAEPAAVRTAVVDRLRGAA